MHFTLVASLSKRQPADVLVLPFWHLAKRPKAASLLEEVASFLKTPLEMEDFQGKEGEILLHYFEGKKEKRILLLGLGKQEELTQESLRKSYATLSRYCQKKKISTINLLLPNIVELRNLNLEEVLSSIAEGLILANYRFDQKFEKETSIEPIKEVRLIGVLPKAIEIIDEVKNITEGVFLARDLINGNADQVIPEYLAKTAQAISKKFPAIKTTIFDRKRIEKEKMGLLLAVGRGSVNDPRFIQMSYQGAPNSKDHTVLIGKGITYDTGGLNIKTSSMETMRDDMSGAACVIATLGVIAALKLKVNVTAVVASCENAVDALSYKPGDVYTSYSGKTVEIGNTDAEGRLTLADAISFSVKNLKPTRMIDLATLTGSMVVALGEGIAGFFSNDDKLASELLDASQKTHEIIWRMPLHIPYKELLKSDIADLKNVGGRAAGSVTAALFLEAFVEKVPWAHLDIAGTAFASKESHYISKNGVGFGVRLLVDLLKNLSK